LQVNYCDLCNLPLKGERHILLLVEEKDFGTGQPGATINPRTTYEIDSGCVELIHKIFTLKKKKLAELTQSLEASFRLPVKTTPKKQRKYKIIRGQQ